MKNQPVKLLFIVNSLGFGGAEKHVITLLNNLDSTQFRLSLAYLKDDDTLLPQLDSKVVEGGVFHCKATRKIDQRVIKQLATHIYEDEVDIVVCTNTYSLLYGWLARIRSGRQPRMVEVFHTTELESMKDSLQFLVYRPLILACHKLVYVCQTQRDYWRARALRARQDTVIHNGIDVDYFVDHYTSHEKTLLRRTYGFSADDYVIGLCAAMRPEKAHGDLLDAIVRLRDGGLDAKALLIGDGHERSKIEAKIHLLGLSQHVRVTGYMADVRPAIAACNVMTLVSHCVETFSIAALEAMALGKPVIMSEIGGASEQIIHGKNGYLFPRGDIGALVNALNQLTDPARCKSMGEHARAIVAQQFSLVAMVNAYEKLFIELFEPPTIIVENRNAC